MSRYIVKYSTVENTYYIYVYMQCIGYIFKSTTYVDSEGIGWSINFSDTGDSGYGCTRGCVIPSPSK